MRPYCASAFLFYGHESDAFRRPVFTWYELSKINAHAEYTTKKVLQIFRFTGLFAEREGFEPPVPLSTPVFKTGAFDHSAISPWGVR